MPQAKKQSRDRYYPTAAPETLERGVLFAQKIMRPTPATPADYERWLFDPLRQPKHRLLWCSYLDCEAHTAHTKREWYSRSYKAFFRGNTMDIQTTRVLPDGWIYLRCWEQFYAFCPAHQSAWIELEAHEAITWFIRMDSAAWLSSPARDRVIYDTFIYAAQKRDVLERRPNI